MSHLHLPDLQTLRRMRFRPRNRVHGHYIGLHDSPQQGQNVEFSEYREYNPGDDVSRIDWKVYGRCNRLMVKRYEHQTNLNATLLLDASTSMLYRGFAPQPLSLMNRLPGHTPPPLDTRDRASKFDQACRLAAATAYLLIQQKDRVGLGLARRGLDVYLPPRGGFPHLERMMGLMRPPVGQHPARLPEALETLRTRTRGRGTLMVFSDLLEREDEVLHGLRTFRTRGDEVLIFHVLHRDELDLPDTGAVLMRDSERGDDLPVRHRDARLDYRRNLERYLHRVQDRCRKEGYDYNLVSTATPYFRVLRRYLQERSRIR